MARADDFAATHEQGAVLDLLRGILRLRGGESQKAVVPAHVFFFFLFMSIALLQWFF